ncbi:MAG: endonuclease/exonuclease/phosphatase family protein [Bacteroidetes bacterium]|nr:endonuclease/exonuclease/phosphatase family protein [Bacteroidota bacterium]
MLNILSIVFKSLNYIIVTALVISISAKYISPEVLWLPAFFGLAFPILVIISVFFLAILLIRLKKTAFINAAVLLMCFPTILKFIRPNFNENLTPQNALKITSYNCMLFDLYNWKHNVKSHDSIFNELKNEKPSIICFQEFYTSEEKNDFNNLDSLKQLLQLPYVHTEYTTTLRNYDHWGIATFSKFPIVNKGQIKFKTKANNTCIFTDVLINDDTIRIYNIHLQSISFSKDDNKFLNAVISEKTEATEEVEHSKSILRRLKRAFVKRGKQADMIATHINQCRYKIILCGDFNDTPASYVYHKISNNLNDAFIEKGSGFEKTYSGNWPQFRIDYILHSKNINCIKYHKSKKTFTDHYPINALFKL